MDKSKFRFDLVDKYAPDIVVRKSLEQIGEATNNYVVGRIEEYSGYIKSHTEKTGLAVLSDITVARNIEVDIQDSLGEQSEIDHRFEVYLSAKKLDKYKYRLMFIDYGATSYPVTVVLNERLARVYSDKYGDTFIIKNMKQLEDLLEKVINSEVLIQIIQNLINEAIRRENAEQEEDSQRVSAIR